MIAVKEQQGSYLASYSELERRVAAREPAWLREIRRAAIERFADLGFPTTRNEEWKYTSVAPIARTRFHRSSGGPEPTPAIARQLERSPLACAECAKLVFIDGCYSGALSVPGIPGSRARTASLAEVLAGHSEFRSLETHLARYARYNDRAFVALNTAFMEDGALIEVPKDVVAEQPIYLLYISTAEPDQEGRAAVSYPRTLVLVGRNAQVTVVEGYLGLGSETYFTNAVTELVADEGATVDYIRMQEESASAYHVGAVQFHQGRSSTVHATTIAFGGALVREDSGTVLAGEGGECTLNGLYVTRGRQHVDNHTTIDHAKPHCSSRELYKGVLEGSSTAVFNGKIVVRTDAQKTDSKQSNKNLLLSEDAVINTKPQLEIYADDVKCTHGATIGQIDAEALFYLRSRGIGSKEARALLTQAFANDVLDRINLRTLRGILKEALLARLAG